jgi:hypothetical protein
VGGLPVFGIPVGTWSACKKCAELVTEKKWAALSERAFRKYVKLNQIPRHYAPSLKIQFADLVRQFATHRQMES